MNLTVKILAGILVVIYPFAIYFGMEYFEPKYLAIILAVIVMTRFVSGLLSPGYESKQIRIGTAILGLIIVGFAFAYNSIDSLKIYPLLINFTLLGVFGYSLFYPPSLIERLARLTNPELPDEAIAYTRKVTQIWCLFFFINGIVSFITAFYTSVEVWTLYNGLLSYLIMGSLFLGEFVYRKLFIEK